ncbi:MAG: type II secretion system F family protein [Actinomycetes bacterium]
MTSTLLLLIGLLGIFGAVALAIVTLTTMTSERAQVSRSLAQIQALRATPSALRQELNRPFAERVVGPTMGRLTQLGRRFTAADQVSRIRRRLELAGNPPRWDVDRVIALKMLGVAIGFVVGVALPVALRAGILPVVGFAVLFSAAGYFAPNMAIYQMGYDRREQMRRDLPDALDLLTISVEAGLAFDAAMSQVARNTSGPVADEFFRVLQEMQIGLGRSEAMRALGDRTDLPELRSFVTAMVQAEAFGIPIAQVLRVQAKEMRVKRTQRAEELAQKVPVKILFPLIFCILPALFVVILGPAAIQIYQSFNGRL